MTIFKIHPTKYRSILRPRKNRFRSASAITSGLENSIQHNEKNSVYKLETYQETKTKSDVAIFTVLISYVFTSQVAWSLFVHSYDDEDEDHRLQWDLETAFPLSSAAWMWLLNYPIQTILAKMLIIALTKQLKALRRAKWFRAPITHYITATCQLTISDERI